MSERSGCEGNCRLSVGHGWESRGLVAGVLQYSGKSNCVLVWPPCPTNSSVKLDFHSGKGATDMLVFPGPRKE